MRFIAADNLTAFNEIEIYNITTDVINSYYDNTVALVSFFNSFSNIDDNTLTGIYNTHSGIIYNINVIRLSFLQSISGREDERLRDIFKTLSTGTNFKNF